MATRIRSGEAMLRTTLAVSRRTALTASLAAATAILLSCGGGDETEPAPMYASLDLVGSWEFVTFRTGVAVGWERGIAAIDPTGVVSLTSFTDSAATVDPERAAARRLASRPRRES